MLQAPKVKMESEVAVSREGVEMEGNLTHGWWGGESSMLWVWVSPAQGSPGHAAPMRELLPSHGIHARQEASTSLMTLPGQGVQDKAACSPHPEGPHTLI